MNQSMLDETGKQFLLQLFKISNADLSAKVSMYEIGESLGMDRGRTDFIITELIASDYVEIKTLSGGVGITSEGIDAAENLTGKHDGQEQDSRIGSDPILNNAAQDACNMMAAGIKSEASDLRLDFDDMAEMMADLKTIDSQLNSPKPKTGIIRECFHSIRAMLEKTGNKKIAARIRKFLE
ncbi:MAG: hypothetical protein R6U27_01220 [Desulfobacterales bacterium]